MDMPMADLDKKQTKIFVLKNVPLVTDQMTEEWISIPFLGYKIVNQVLWFIWCEKYYLRYAFSENNETYQRE